MEVVYTAHTREEKPLLKIAIVLLMLALVASLGSGFYYLMLDQGAKGVRRTFHSLGIRLGMAIVLAGLVVYGIATGQLGHQNPWDAGPKPHASQKSKPQ